MQTTVAATPKSQRRRIDDPAVLAWLRLVRVFLKIDRASVEHFRQWDMTPAQFDVLSRVGTAEGMNQQELANWLLVTKGNVCQLLDRMSQAGLIERRPEGRINRLYLTEKGRRIREVALPAHEALIAEQLSALSPEEQVQLLGLLRTLDHSLPD